MRGPSLYSSDISPLKKDEKINTSEGIARVKPVKNLGTNEAGKKVQAFTVKKEDGATITNRFEDGEQTDMSYNPKKMKVKKMRKKRVPKGKIIEPGATPSYTAPAVTLDKNTQAISDARDNKSTAKKIIETLKKIKLPKINKGRKIRKTRNLVTGKMNKTRG